MSALRGKSAMTVLVELVLTQRGRIDKVKGKLLRRASTRGEVRDYDLRSVEFHNELLQVYATCTRQVAELAVSARELLANQSASLTPNHVQVPTALLAALQAALVEVSPPDVTPAVPA